MYRSIWQDGTLFKKADFFQNALTCFRLPRHYPKPQSNILFRCRLLCLNLQGPKNEKIGSVLSKEVANILTKFENFELGYVLSSEVELDFPKELVNNYQSEISIVKGNDCAVQVKGRKNYRVLLRPTLSSVNFGQTTPK